MHHVDADKEHRDKARWEVHKNATSYTEQIQETALICMATYLSALKPSKTKKISETLLEKQGRTLK